MNLSNPKLLSLESAVKAREEMRQAGRRVVLTNGVFDLLHNIEVKAVRVRDLGRPAAADDGIRMDLDGTAVPIVLPMERPLYRRSRTSSLEAPPIEAGAAELDRAALFDQLHVDRDALVRTVLERLGPRDAIRLDQVVAASPLQQGLAERVGYLSIDVPGLALAFDDDARARIPWAVPDEVDDLDPEHPVNGLAGGGVVVERVADLPVVTISRQDSDR